MKQMENTATTVTILVLSIILCLHNESTTINM